MADQPLEYRKLAKILRKHGAKEVKSRGKGSERYWERELDDGTIVFATVTCHGKGKPVGRGLIRSIRRKLKLSSQDDVGDKEFYGK